MSAPSSSVAREGAFARRQVAEAAVISLVAEQRRLEQLRLEWPLARAAHQLRYWRFVRALCAIAEEAA